MGYRRIVGMALSVLPASKVVGGFNVLISAGEDGKVTVYPNSFSARPHDGRWLDEVKIQILQVSKEVKKTLLL
jgi:hypothetical protein